MLKDRTKSGRRRTPATRAGDGARSNRRGREEKPGAAEAVIGGRPDSRAIALEMLSGFLLAGAKPPKGRPPMPAPPRLPADGTAMPRTRGAAPPMVASSPPPRVPFPAPPPPTAMAALARFLEAARAGGLADRRRRRG